MLITSCSTEVQEKSEDISSTLSTVVPAAPRQNSGEPIVVEEYEKVGANVFGDFHSNRFRLFTKENPDVEIEGSDVNSLVFYYIDEDLLQKRYELTDDVRLSKNLR